jgi:pimeloyl-ACP methyl ester carboxylesterase
MERVYRGILAGVTRVPETDLDAFQGMSCAVHRSGVDGGAALRVLRFAGDGARRPPVVLVPGWVSLATPWAPVIRALVADGPVDYVESREKCTSELPPTAWRRELFTLEQAGRDLRRVVEDLGHDPRQVVFIASSLGANAVLEALNGGMRCRAAVLIGPNTTVRFPWWGHGLIRLPVAAYHLARPVVELYLARFRVNAEREPEQMERYRATLRAADPKRLKLSALAVADASLPDDLGDVVDPVMIAYAPSDSLHGGDALKTLADRLPRGEAVAFPSNRALHDGRLVEGVDGFLGRD